jgi:hypothetical protein
MFASDNFRKIWFGCADRRQMFRLFDRHAARPGRFETYATSLYAGEWFELGKSESDYMLDVLPPLWMRGGMFAMREFMIGAVTSVFFTIPINDRVRHFHGYCDLSRRQEPERMRKAIIARESRPERAMNETERLEHIWSDTTDAYRGYADETWPVAVRGERWVMVYSDEPSGCAKLVTELTEAEIIAKLPVQYRQPQQAVAA